MALRVIGEYVAPAGKDNPYAADIDEMIAATDKAGKRLSFEVDVPSDLFSRSKRGDILSKATYYIAKAANDRDRTASFVGEPRFTLKGKPIDESQADKADNAVLTVSIKARHKSGPRNRNKAGTDVAVTE